MNALWRRQFDIDENETYCVNYKYCLVDAVCNYKYCLVDARSVYQIGTPNPVAGVATLTAVAKSCLVASVYGFVVRFAPETSCADTLSSVYQIGTPNPVHAPRKLVPKRAIFGYFFANERPVASSIRHR